MEEQRKAIKPKVNLTIIYFAVLGLYFGWTFFMLNWNAGLIPIILFVVGPLAAAWGISQYEKWGRSLGLFVSWILLIGNGYWAFSLMGLLADGYNPSELMRLIVHLVFCVTSVLVIRFLSGQKNAFYD